MVDPTTLNEQKKSTVGITSPLQQLQPTRCHLLQALERFDYGELAVFPNIVVHFFTFWANKIATNKVLNDHFRWLD